MKKILLAAGVAIVAAALFLQWFARVDKPPQSAAAAPRLQLEPPLEQPPAPEPPVSAAPPPAVAAAPAAADRPPESETAAASDEQDDDYLAQLDDERRAALLERLQAGEVDPYQELFDADPPDPEAEQAAAAELEASFARFGERGIAASAVDCRAQFCRVTLSGVNHSNIYRFMTEVDRALPWRTEVEFWRLPATEEGELTLYVARMGEHLPRGDAPAAE